MALLGDEEGVIHDVRGSRTDDGHSYFTVLDNVLTVWEAARAKSELAGPFLLRGPPRRAGMGIREIAQWWTSLRRSGGNKSAALDVWRSPAAILTKAKNANVVIITGVFLAIFRKSCIHTSTLVPFVLVTTCSVSIHSVSYICSMTKCSVPFKLASSWSNVSLGACRYWILLRFLRFLIACASVPKVTPGTPPHPCDRHYCRLGGNAGQQTHLQWWQQCSPLDACVSV